MKPQLSSLLAIGLSLAAVGCAEEEPWELTATSKTSTLFAEGVYPVLLRDCAFFACHGSTERLFQVWGPKRRRMNDLPLTGDEELARIDMEMKKTFEMAVGFVDVNDPGNSLLLRKGLDPQAGGTGHLGLDKYGRNVYRSGSSPGYLTLAKWVYDLQAKAKSKDSADGF
jgi:hypothetical protein